MENTTRTIYGSRLQAMLSSKLPFSMDQNTTLNEKFAILAGQNPPAGDYPAVQYYCIGNGGHELANGTGGIALANAKQHTAVHAALYSHLPFVLRATNNDISNSEQQKYALRRVETYGGVNYYAYYLKRIPVDSAVVNTVIQTTQNGVTSSATFVPSADNLSPTPPSLDPDNVNLLQAQYANVSALLPLTLTSGEISEILDASEIIYGDQRYAIISEIGLVSAFDHEITLPNSNTMKEAICAQVNAFISTVHMLQYASTGINGSFNLGTNEPMLVLGTA